MGARLLIQRKIDGKELDEDREDGITFQLNVHFIKSNQARIKGTLLCCGISQAKMEGDL